MTLARISLDHHNGIPVAKLEGEVDAANARKVASELLESLSNRTTGMVIDLTATRYLDSAGLSVLFELHEMLHARRQGLSLVVDPGAPLNRILDISGVRAAVPTHAELSSALSGLSD